MWVNHEYRVMYVRHAKSGSTTVLNHFGRCLVPAEQGPGERPATAARPNADVLLPPPWMGCCCRRGWAAAAATIVPAGSLPGASAY